MYIQLLVNSQGKLNSVCVQLLQLNVIIRTIGFIGRNPAGTLATTQSVKQMEVQTLLCVLRGDKSHITGQQSIASCTHSCLYCLWGLLHFFCGTNVESI